MEKPPDRRIKDDASQRQDSHRCGDCQRQGIQIEIQHVIIAAGAIVIAIQRAAGSIVERCRAAHQRQSIVSLRQVHIRHADRRSGTAEVCREAGGSKRGRRQQIDERDILRPQPAGRQHFAHFECKGLAAGRQHIVAGNWRTAHRCLHNERADLIQREGRRKLGGCRTGNAGERAGRQRDGVITVTGSKTAEIKRNRVAVH